MNRMLIILLLGLSFFAVQARDRFTSPDNTALSAIEDIAELPATSAGKRINESTRACHFSKAMVRKNQAELGRLSREGYSDYERKLALDAVRTWQKEAEIYCH